MSTNENNQDTSEVKLGFYTGSVMIATLSSAAAMVLSLLFFARAPYYVVKSYFGKDMIEEFLDLYRECVFSADDEKKLFAMTLVAGILSAISAVMMLVAIARIMDPLKKPAVIPTIIATSCELVALVIYISTIMSNKRLIDTFFEDYEAEFGKMMSMYNYSFIAVAVNFTLLIVAVIGVLVGKAKWISDGKAY